MLKTLTIDKEKFCLYASSFLDSKEGVCKELVAQLEPLHYKGIRKSTAKFKLKGFPQQTVLKLITEGLAKGGYLDYFARNYHAETSTIHKPQNYFILKGKAAFKIWNKRGIRTTVYKKAEMLFTGSEAPEVNTLVKGGLYKKVDFPIFPKFLSERQEVLDHGMEYLGVSTLKVEEVLQDNRNLPSLFWDFLTREDEVYNFALSHKSSFEPVHAWDNQRTQLAFTEKTVFGRNELSPSILKIMRLPRAQEEVSTKPFKGEVIPVKHERVVRDREVPKLLFDCPIRV